jgi:rhodanese-related sulfurtransferase
MTQQQAARQISTATAKKLAAEGGIFVDVREKPEIEQLAYDVPNLVAIPLSEFANRFNELPRDRDLIMVCKAGGRSLQATHFLLGQGFDRVVNMEGGIMDWAGNGFPVK